MNNYNTYPAAQNYRSAPYVEQYIQNPTWPNQVYPSINQGYQNLQASNSIIWVQGENAAKSYPVGPNTAVALWDSEQQTIYIKSVDSNGRPSLKILDYVDRDNEVVSTDEKTYVTQDEMNMFSEKINQQMAELQKNLNDFKSKVGNMKKVK